MMHVRLINLLPHIINSIINFVMLMLLYCSSVVYCTQDMIYYKLLRFLVILLIATVYDIQGIGAIILLCKTLCCSHLIFDQLYLMKISHYTVWAIACNTCKLIDKD